MIDPTELKRMLSEHQKYHSPFQIQEFVLQDHSGGTAYGYYKQCLRELKKRVRNLQLAMIEVARQKIKHKALVGMSWDPLVELDIDELELAMGETELTTQEQWRELNLFYAHAVKVRAELPKELTPEIRHQLDIEMWEGIIASRMELETEIHGKYSMETARMLKRLDPNIRREMVNAAKAGTLVAPHYEPFPINIDITPLPPREEVLELCSNLKPLLTA